ncbi:MAG: DoxX family protein [Fluviicola sp.]
MKKTTHMLLWIAQILLAITLIWAAFLKLFQPISELAKMWSWAGEVSPLLVRFTGVVDLLGGLGMILPALFRFKPVITALAALGIFFLMISAIIFHICRGEASQIGFNVVFGLIAGVVALGRFKTVPAGK